MSARDQMLARVRAAIAPLAGASEPILRDYRASTEEGIDVFLDRLAGLLEARGVEVLRFRKPTYTKPAPPDLRREIGERCEAVVVALAD